jgi:hypothetical protein
VVAWVWSPVAGISFGRASDQKKKKVGSWIRTVAFLQYTQNDIFNLLLKCINLLSFFSLLQMNTWFIAVERRLNSYIDLLHGRQYTGRPHTLARGVLISVLWRTVWKVRAIWGLTSSPCIDRLLAVVRDGYIYAIWRWVLYQPLDYGVRRPDQ